MTCRPNWRGRNVVAISAGGSHALVILDTLEGPFRRGDGLEWRDALLAFEADWMLPAQQSLSTGRLRELRLIANGERGGIELRVARTDLWKLWRRPGDPIAAFAETELP